MKKKHTQTPRNNHSACSHHTMPHCSVWREKLHVLLQNVINGNSVILKMSQLKNISFRFLDSQKIDGVCMRGELTGDLLMLSMCICGVLDGSIEFNHALLQSTNLHIALLLKPTGAIDLNAALFACLKLIALDYDWRIILFSNTQNVYFNTYSIHSIDIQYV